MAIRFNMMFGDIAIRTLEDLREHFCVQDVLAHYEKGLLVRWLDCHGYEDEKNRCKKLLDPSMDRKELLRELCEVILGEDAKQYIARATETFALQEELKQEIAEGLSKSGRWKSWLSEHYEMYQTQRKKLTEWGGNAVSKDEVIKKICDNYWEFLVLDSRNLLESLIKNNSYGAIVSLLKNLQSRSLFLSRDPEDTGEQKPGKSTVSQCSKVLKEMMSKKGILSEMETAMGQELKKCELLHGEGGDLLDCVEDGCRVMIIYIDCDKNARFQSLKDGDEHDQLYYNGMFRILDEMVIFNDKKGKSTATVYYVEVRG